MKMTFTPVEADLRHAYGLHIRRTGWKRLGYLLLFGAAIGVILAAINGFEDPTQTFGLIAGMMLWAGIVALIMQFAIPRWWVPRLARKIYNQQKDLHLETTTWWDDEILHSENDQGTARIRFTDLVKWRRDEEIILLYRSDQLFNFIPLRIFENASHCDALIRRLGAAGVREDD